MRRAVGAAHGEGFGLHFAGLEVLHVGVGDVVGPDAGAGDAQAAQRAVAGGDAGGLEHRLACIGVGNGEGACVGQDGIGGVFDDGARIVARDERGIVGADDGDGCGGGIRAAVAVGDRVGEGVLADLPGGQGVELAVRVVAEAAVGIHREQRAAGEGDGAAQRLAVHRGHGDGIPIGVAVVGEQAGAAIGNSERPVFAEGVRAVERRAAAAGEAGKEVVGAVAAASGGVQRLEADAVEGLAAGVDAERRVAGGVRRVQLEGPAGDFRTVVHRDPAADFAAVFITDQVGDGELRLVQVAAEVQHDRFGLAGGGVEFGLRGHLAARTGGAIDADGVGVAIPAALVERAGAAVGIQRDDRGRVAFAVDFVPTVVAVVVAGAGRAEIAVPQRDRVGRTGNIVDGVRRGVDDDRTVAARCRLVAGEVGLGRYDGQRAAERRCVFGEGDGAVVVIEATERVALGVGELGGAVVEAEIDGARRVAIGDLERHGATGHQLGVADLHADLNAVVADLADRELPVVRVVVIDDDDRGRRRRGGVEHGAVGGRRGDVARRVGDRRGDDQLGTFRRTGHGGFHRARRDLVGGEDDVLAVDAVGNGQRVAGYRGCRQTHGDRDGGAVAQLAVAQERVVVGVAGDDDGRCIGRRGVQRGIVVGLRRVAGGVGDAGIHGQRTVAQAAQVDVGTVAAVRVGRSGDGDVRRVRVVVADHQGDSATAAHIGGAGDGGIADVRGIQVVEADGEVGDGVQVGVVDRLGRVAGGVGDTGIHGQRTVAEAAEVGRGAVAAVGVGHGSDGDVRRARVAVADHQRHGAPAADVGSTAQRGIGHGGAVEVVEGDGEIGLGIDGIRSIGSRAGDVTGLVAAGDGCDNVVVRRQVAAADVDAEAQIAVGQLNHVAVVDHAADVQRDGVADPHVATHGAGESNGAAVGFGAVDHVVRGDRVEGDGDGRRNQVLRQLSLTDEGVVGSDREAIGGGGIADGGLNATRRGVEDHETVPATGISCAGTRSGRACCGGLEGLRRVSAGSDGLLKVCDRLFGGGDILGVLGARLLAPLGITAQIEHPSIAHFQRDHPGRAGQHLVVLEYAVTLHEQAAEALGRYRKDLADNTFDDRDHAAHD